MYIKLAPCEDQPARWAFLDEDESLDQYYDSLNAKGIREKKLQENHKKIKALLKLKKPKKLAQKNDEQEQSEEKEEDAEMKDVEEKEAH
jgi:hypothetical protein